MGGVGHEAGEGVDGGDGGDLVDIDEGSGAKGIVTAIEDAWADGGH